MQKLLRILALASALAAFAAPRLAAQKESALDDKELKSYRLTMATVKKFENAVEALANWAKNDPQTQANIRMQAAIDSLREKEELTEAEEERLEKLEQQRASMGEKEDDETSDDPSIDDIAAAIAKMPPVANALRRAGLTSREYVVMSLALFEAQAYVSLKQQGLITEIPKDANTANVKFVQDNAAVLKLLYEKLEKVNKAFELPTKKGS